MNFIINTVTMIHVVLVAWHMGALARFKGEVILPLLVELGR